MAYEDPLDPGADTPIGGGVPAGPKPAGACPPGMVTGPRGDCRHPGDFPCPPGQCKDVVSAACRTPGKNEKVNETDDIERDTGGGRGYCRQRDGGGGGGGGAAGAGAAAPKAPTSGSPTSTFNNVAGMFGGQSKSIWDSLAAISGGQTRFSPEVMANLDSQAALARSAQAKAGERAAVNDSIRRGMGRSTNRDVGLAQRGADATFTQTLNANRLLKVKTDFEDKMQALTLQEKWLDDMQKHIATLDSTAATRERDQANIALGYARIAAERAMLTQRIGADLEIARMGNALGWFSATAGAAGL